MKKDNC